MKSLPERLVPLTLLLGSLLVALSVQAAPPENRAYVTSQANGLIVIDLSSLKPIKTVAVGPDPRGVGITPDGRWVLTANQGSADVSVIDTEAGKEVRRIPVGKNVEFLRVAPGGDFAYVTYEPSAKAGPPGKPDKGKKEEDDDGPAQPAQIAVIDLKAWQVVGRMEAAPETEGIEFSPDRKFMVVANEGNSTLTVYDLGSRRVVKTLDLSSFGNRPRGVKVAPDGRHYVVTLENSGNFLWLDDNFQVLKSVPTAAGPYGVSFDRTGQQLWIAAARAGQLQVFDTRSLSPVASIPVGKRCWHFSFTPDGQKVLLACGKSDFVQVVDVQRRQVVDTLADYKTPWGIVTYPKTAGSLDAP